MLRLDPHPSLDLAAFTTSFPSPLGDVATSRRVQGLLDPGAEAPFARDDDTQRLVRDVLRHGGYKPTGRGKPSSEYLARAASDGGLRSINAAVDACNAVSLHSGLPISVVDLDRAEPPLSVRVAATGSRYVFNASGQEIDVSGLACLHDASGPCACAVKDSQRTKTDEATMRTLSLVWGPLAVPGLTASVADWYRELLEEGGARTGDVEPQESAEGGRA